MPLNLSAVRAQFPALARQAIFLDNPAGTQVARPVVRRIQEYLIEHNANHDGAFQTSRESDALIDEARAGIADFYNAGSPEEIVFGPNMTSLTFNLSRSIARTWQAGDEIVVTHLDHDANITPWVMAAEEHGVKVRRVDFDPRDGTLNLDAMAKALERRPRLVAVGYASNALGTINPVGEIVQMAHDVGARVYIDAVQYAPHGAISSLARMWARCMANTSYWMN
jgi:selenocysteine lyase/cysteine desulfurase